MDAIEYSDRRIVRKRKIEKINVERVWNASTVVLELGLLKYDLSKNRRCQYCDSSLIHDCDDYIEMSIEWWLRAE